jgi:excisionase family DNA binding protein
MDESEKYYTVDEVAEKIRKKPRYVRYLCAQGTLGATKPRGARAWLIPKESLDDYLKIIR